MPSQHEFDSQIEPLEGKYCVYVEYDGGHSKAVHFVHDCNNELLVHVKPPCQKTEYGYNENREISYRISTYQRC